MASSLPFQLDNPLSIFEYSAQLMGKTLQEWAGTDLEERKGRGRLGQMVEEVFFGYEVNSNPSPDFEEAGVELKCTPLLRGKDNYRIKERLVCNMIDFHGVINETFEESHFLRKCQLMLLLFYLHEQSVPVYQLKFLFRALWQIPQKDLAIMKADYEKIIGKIKAGQAHELSEGDTMYLGACTKGKNNRDVREQPFSDIPARRRAFSLKPAYMRTLLDQIVQSGGNALCNYQQQSERQPELVAQELLQQKTFEEIILERFAPFMGKDYVEIANALSLPLTTAKHKYAILANAIASNLQMSKIDDSEEFKKSGIRLKTARVNVSGIPEEAMSFQNIDWIELYENGKWEDSVLYQLFTSRFLFVTFKKVTGNITRSTPQKTKSEDRYILDKVFFWTMPSKDLKSAFRYWVHLRRLVIHNKLDKSNYWKEKDDKNFHVRPKGTKENYRNNAPTPYDEKVDKQCYWFNKSYLKTLIDEA